MVAFSDPRGRTINVFIIYVPHRTSAATAGASSTSTGASAPAAARTSWTAGTSPSSATSTFDAQGACGQDRPTAFEGRGTARSAARWPSRTRSAILTAPFLAFAICGRPRRARFLDGPVILELLEDALDRSLAYGRVRVHDVPLRCCADELLEICA